MRRETARRYVNRLADVRRDFANVLRYGVVGPRVDERIWIDPAAIVSATEWFPARSAQVVSAWPPAPLVPFEEHTHVRYALAHWRDGVPWEETGAYAYMLEQIARRGQQDGCRTLEDVVARYKRLDDLYDVVRREGRLRTRQEVQPRARGENGGILVHVGPDGEPVAGDSGKHRLTIARVLGLDVVPARLGIVHREAVSRLPALRAQ